MMGQKDGQLQMIVMDLGELIPQNHLLKQINSLVRFDVIYETMAHYYSQIGRPSIDPVCMVKMLLIGYLYGVKSERRLMEEVGYNLACGWFCGFELTDSIALDLRLRYLCRFFSHMEDTKIEKWI